MNFLLRGAPWSPSPVLSARARRFKSGPRSVDTCPLAEARDLGDRRAVNEQGE